MKRVRVTKYKVTTRSLPHSSVKLGIVTNDVQIAKVMIHGNCVSYKPSREIYSK